MTAPSARRSIKPFFFLPLLAAAIERSLGLLWTAILERFHVGANTPYDDGMKETLHPATLPAQALGTIAEATKAIITPLHLATTYIRDPDNQYRTGLSYGRPDNATVDQAEALLARLEGGAEALLFGSGMAAATSVFLALKP